MIGKDGMIKNKTRTSNSTRSQWSSLNPPFILTSHSVGISKIARTKSQ
jgi:hypothetical protein